VNLNNSTLRMECGPSWAVLGQSRMVCPLPFPPHNLSDVVDSSNAPKVQPQACLHLSQVCRSPRLHTCRLCAWTSWLQWSHRHRRVAYHPHTVSILAPCGQDRARVHCTRRVLLDFTTRQSPRGHPSALPSPLAFPIFLSSSKRWRKSFGRSNAAHPHPQ